MRTQSCPLLALLVGDRRVTVVFDRGGWSPTLFQKLLWRSVAL